MLGINLEEEEVGYYSISTHLKCFNVQSKEPDEVTGSDATNVIPALQLFLDCRQQSVKMNIFKGTLWS